MTKKLEDEIERLEEKLYKINSHYGKLITILRQQLKESGECSHKKTATYSWEHDNGYGVQTRHYALYCLTCGLEDKWPDTKDGKYTFRENVK